MPDLDPVAAPEALADAPLLSPSEAAAYLAGKGLNLTDQTLYRWAKARRVRHIALPSGLVKFRPDDLDELLAPIEPNSDEAGAA